MTERSNQADEGGDADAEPVDAEPVDSGQLEGAARRYIEAIAPVHRALFDRLHGLILQAYPDATVTISYQMPTYHVGGRSLVVGVWKHGLSLYGWEIGHATEFLARHPNLRTSKGTLQVRPVDAKEITDDEFRELVRVALDD